MPTLPTIYRTAVNGSTINLSASPVPSTLTNVTYSWSTNGGSTVTSGTNSSFTTTWNSVNTFYVYCVITSPASGSCPASDVTQPIQYTITAAGSGGSCSPITGCTITP